jgi:hypothetical protein
MAITKQSLSATIKVSLRFKGHPTSFAATAT